jgi:hypothetical protein
MVRLCGALILVVTSFGLNAWLNSATKAATAVQLDRNARRGALQ